MKLLGYVSRKTCSRKRISSEEKTESKEMLGGTTKKEIA